MAKNAYIGVNGKSKKIKQMYIGVNGKSKKIIKAYIGVNGKSKQFWPNEFQYTFKDSKGNNLTHYTSGDFGGDFVIAFPVSGTFTITNLGNCTAIDIFCVANGANGDPSEFIGWTYWNDKMTGVIASYYYSKSGNGGAGGKCSTTSNKAITTTSYAITVGTNSSFANLASANGQTTNGGWGANRKADNTGSTAGGDGTAAFGDANFTTPYGKGIQFGAGGGGGYGSYVQDDYRGNAVAWNTFNQSSGGKTGGGNGGAKEANGENATMCGGGGGGAGGIGPTRLTTAEGKKYNKNGGSGHSGVVIIRNHR